MPPLSGAPTVIPGGKPALEKVNGPVPPLVVTTWSYGTPTRPGGSVASEIEMTGHATLMWYSRSPRQPLASVAVTVNV